VHSFPTTLPGFGCTDDQAFGPCSGLICHSQELFHGFTHSQGDFDDFDDPEEHAFVNDFICHSGKARPMNAKPKGKKKKQHVPQHVSDAHIKRVISTLAETKSIQFTSSENVFGYNAAAQGLCSIQLTPTSGMLNITQGTGEGDRIGNKVRVKKVKLNYVLVTAPIDATYNVTPKPQDVRMMITYNKQSKVLSPPAGQFFDAGDSSNAPTSNLLDMVAAINTEYVGCPKEWRHKVGCQTSPHPNTLDNNDYKLNEIRSLDITKFYPKTLTWNDTSSVIMEQSKWLTFLLAPADGSAIDTSGTSTFKPLFFYWCINLEFQDY